METYRELRPVEDVRLEDLSLQRINELVLLINQGQAQPIETIKSTLQDAVPFLEKKRFMLQEWADHDFGRAGVRNASGRPFIIPQPDGRFCGRA